MEAQEAVAVTRIAAPALFLLMNHRRKNNQKGQHKRWQVRQRGAFAVSTFQS
jgi:hypothetical protein